MQRRCALKAAGANKRRERKLPAARCSAECDGVPPRKKKSRKGFALPALKSCERDLLELEAKPELNPARIAVDGADPHEVRIREAGHRVAPSHVIENVAGLHPELDAIPSD